MGGEIGLAVPLFVEQRLPLAHHAEVAVVDQRDLDRHAFDRTGRQLLIGHLEAAVTVDRPHLGLRAAHLGAHRGRNREAHGAQTAGVDPRLRVLVGDELRRPHLVLTHTCHVDRIRPGGLAEGLDDEFRGQAAVALRSVAQRVRRLDPAQRLPPRVEIDRTGAVPAQHLDQIGDHVLDVTDDRHVRMPVLADLGRVDVGVDDLGLGGERIQLPGDPVVEAGAQGDQQVAALQRRHRRHGAVHAGHAQVLRVAVGERTAGHQRGDHRDTGQLGQVEQLLGGLAADHAAADVEHRLARLGDQLGRLTDLAAVRLGVRLVSGQLELRRPRERALALQHVLGDVDQHRPRPSAGGDVECLGDDARDVVTVAHQEVVLGDRHRDAGDVGFLERVGADQGAPDLPGDRDHRNRIHVGVGQRRDQVGRTRTRGRHADADPAGGVRVAAGGVAAALLVTHQHVAQLLRIEQWVVHRKHRPARDAEDDVDAELLERADNRLRSGELLRGNDIRLRLGRRGVVLRGGRCPVRRGLRRLGRSLGGCAHGVLWSFSLG